mmetsp:Transcript_47791/g.53479  ORF Transcript_47791/g.53479 Transcript_47791/m.53479 type:complete len:205 (+) Transcript_47791:53-667(+)
MKRGSCYSSFSTLHKGVGIVVIFIIILIVLPYSCLHFPLLFLLLLCFPLDLLLLLLLCTSGDSTSIGTITPHKDIEFLFQHVVTTIAAAAVATATTAATNTIRIRTITPHCIRFDDTARRDRSYHRFFIIHHIVSPISFILYSNDVVGRNSRGWDRCRRSTVVLLHSNDVSGCNVANVGIGTRIRNRIHIRLPICSRCDIFETT